MYPSLSLFLPCSRKVSEYTDYNVGGTPDDAVKAAALQAKEKEVCFSFSSHRYFQTLTFLLQLEDMRRQMALLQAQLRGAQQSDAV